MGRIPSFQGSLILVYVFCDFVLVSLIIESILYFIFVNLVHTFTNTRQTHSFQASIQSETIMMLLHVFRTKKN